MPDAAPAQRILLSEPVAATAAERPKPRSKRTPPPEHASDEGLFTGSIQAVERASFFLHGDQRDASEDDADETEPGGSEPHVRDWLPALGGALPGRCLGAVSPSVRLGSAGRL